MSHNNSAILSFLADSVSILKLSFCSKTFSCKRSKDYISVTCNVLLPSWSDRLYEFDGVSFVYSPHNCSIYHSPFTCRFAAVIIVNMILQDNWWSFMGGPFNVWHLTDKNDCAVALNTLTTFMLNSPSRPPFKFEKLIDSGRDDSWLQLNVACSKKPSRQFTHESHDNLYIVNSYTIVSNISFLWIGRRTPSRLR
jgi:hypothetical protein